MDTKRMVIGTVLAMALFLGWYFFISWANTKFAPPEHPAQTASDTTTTGAGGTSTQPTTSTAVEAGATSQPATTGLQLLAAGKANAAVTLGSEKHEDKQFAMLLKTTPAGAGIDSVVLNSFYRVVGDPAPYAFQSADAINDPANAAVVGEFGHPLATRSVKVDGQSVDVSKANWILESQDATSVTYSITLGTGGQPVAKVLKTFRISPRTEANLGYEVRVDYVIENHAGRPINVSLVYNGPALPPRELDAGPDQRVLSGYNGGGSIKVDNNYVATFAKDNVTRDIAVNSDKAPMLWAGGSSVYFQAVVMPPVTQVGATVASTTKSFKAVGLKPDEKEKQPVALSAETVDLNIAANQQLTYPLTVYLGPKARKVLDETYYATLPRHFDQTLVVRTGPCSICTFDWLINVLVRMLAAFHTVTRDWGLAIMCLVILVRLALHPITKRSQVSMMKMGKMGPEVERLKKKYADNKEELQKAMWDFQKQQGITPILGCLPMFLQMPIWIALWSALNTTFELRHSSFLWGLTWIHDLAKPDRLIRFPNGFWFTIPFLGTHVDAINLLPVLLAGVFFLQQKFTPKPPTMTPEQAQQQKIMQGMMVFLFPLFLYAQPSGLNLYIMTSTGIGIWESRRIRAHIKEKEEAEKAGILIVDAEPSSGGGKRRKDDTGRGGGGSGGSKQPAAPAGGWLARKLAELQEKAEQARRQGERRGRDRA